MDDLPATFRLTDDHLKLLRRLHVAMRPDGYQPGADIVVGEKKPYGGSAIEEDIAEILGWVRPDEGGVVSLADRPEVVARATAIHLEMGDALQILLIHAGRAVRTGLYRRACEFDATSWEWAGE